VAPAGILVRSRGRALAVSIGALARQAQTAAAQALLYMVSRWVLRLAPRRRGAD